MILESTSPEKTLVKFEGMSIPQEKVDEIKSLRSDAQNIKDGIDIEHINNIDDLVNQFRIALVRAEREKNLVQLLHSD